MTFESLDAAQTETSINLAEVYVPFNFLIPFSVFELVCLHRIRKCQIAPNNQRACLLGC